MHTHICVNAALGWPDGHVRELVHMVGAPA